MPDPRLILYHKQPISARTRFLQLPDHTVCAFAALPATTTLAERTSDQSNLISHPAFLLRAAENRLALPQDSLEAEPGYRCLLHSPEGIIEVFLARFTAIDPPCTAAETIGGTFIDLTQARGLPRVELELLRLAYERILD